MNFFRVSSASTAGAFGLLDITMNAASALKKHEKTCFLFFYPLIDSLRTTCVQIVCVGSSTVNEKTNRRKQEILLGFANSPGAGIAFKMASNRRRSDNHNLDSADAVIKRARQEKDETLNEVTFTCTMMRDNDGDV